MKKQKSIKSLFMSQRIIALSCLVFLFLFFSCFGKNFLTKNSMVSLLESVYYIICLAFGMTFVISTGGIDLSIGSVAMCGALIAACDSGALDEQMITARDAGIPVIAYDITFDNAPEGSLTATSASDSILAAGQAADELLKNETVVEKIKAATPENPAVFSVIAPDAIMTVHRDRTSGFANRMYELCQEWQPGAVAITGNDAFAKDSEKDPAVIIRTDIAASRADEDIRNLAQSVVSDSSVLAIFCVNEASATGILSATSDGLDLDRTNGKYKDLIVIGFDSGSTLNNAVRSGYFYGAVAQDPYTMGYEAMMMAINVLQGGEASDIVIPAVWFDASNMDDPEISRILYD